MDMYQKRKMRQEKNVKKCEEQELNNKMNINCEKPININIDSNHWEYWNLYVEIFTFFLKLR